MEALDRSKRPRPCCREATQKRPLAVPPGGRGVLANGCEICTAPADDGLVVLDGVRVCGRRHWWATMQSGHYGATPGRIAEA